MNITELLTKPPIARSELARRAGVSRNTEWSIRRDQNRARLDTLREIALACGYDVEVTLRRAYDAVAVAAARNMLGDLDLRELAQISADLLGGHADWTTVSDWSERLRRYSVSDARPDMDRGTDSGAPAGESSTGVPPLTIAVEAAEFAGAQNAPGAIMLTGRNDVTRLMSAALATDAEFRVGADADERFGHKWVFSGWPALEALGAVPLITPLLGAGEPAVTGQQLPTVVWTTLPTQFSQYLGATHRKVGTVRAATVIVAPLEAHQLVGTGDLEGVPLVSPVQAVIDSLGIGGDLATVAFNLAREW